MLACRALGKTTALWNAVTSGDVHRTASLTPQTVPPWHWIVTSGEASPGHLSVHPAPDARRRQTAWHALSGADRQKRAVTSWRARASAEGRNGAKNVPFCPEARTAGRWGGRWTLPRLEAFRSLTFGRVRFWERQTLSAVKLPLPIGSRRRAFRSRCWSALQRRKKVLRTS